MRRWISIAVLTTVSTLVVWLLIPPSRQSQAAAAEPSLGINLAGISDYSREMVFVDAMRISRPWISQVRGGAWGAGKPLELDSAGYPKKLEPNHWAETLIFVDIGDRYPGGKYVCTFRGKGDVELGGSAEVTAKEPGQMQVRVTPAKGMISLKITKTDPADPVRDIRLIPADRVATAEKEPFHPTLLKRLEGFQVIRFMDWQRTNDSPVRRWSERTKPGDATQAGNRGAAVEVMVDLANQTGCDPWFCMPHLADDEYVTEFARVVKERLKADRKVYVEYSNETWNGQFAQARYCREQGLQAGLSKNDYEAQLRYSARRSVEIFEAFQKGFGDRKRAVFVLSAQSANPWTGTTVMDWNEAFKKCDAIAVAPYFGGPYGDPKTAERTARMSVDELLDGLKTAIESNRKALDTYAAEARKRNLKLLAYESGQHLAGYGGAENNADLTRLFHAANRHPRMKELYLQDLRSWNAAGGGLNCVFSSVGGYGKWGSWSLLEYYDQDESSAPKMAAVREFMKQRPPK